MIINGAIFDLDGTVLDSMHIWNTFGEDYLTRRGIEPRENLTELFKTMTMTQSAEYYREHYGITDSVETIIDDMNRVTEEFYFNEAQPKNEICEVLEELYKRNVKMCVATATDKYLIEAALKRLGLRKYFSEIFTCSMVGCGKHKPDIYNAALKHLGCDRESTWVFEDAAHAAKTASDAGFKVCGIYDKFEPEQEFLKSTADVYVRSIKEFLSEM